MYQIWGRQKEEKNIKLLYEIREDLVELCKEQVIDDGYIDIEVRKITEERE